MDSYSVLFVAVVVLKPDFCSISGSADNAGFRLDEVVIPIFQIKLKLGLGLEQNFDNLYTHVSLHDVVCLFVMTHSAIMMLGHEIADGALH